MDIVTTGGALAVVIGLVQIIKLIIGDSRFAPLIALVIGIGISFLVATSFEIRQVIFQGIIYGLSAAGLYSGAKTMIKPTDPQP